MINHDIPEREAFIPFKDTAPPTVQHAAMTRYDKCREGKESPPTVILHRLSFLRMRTPRHNYYTALSPANSALFTGEGELRRVY